MQISSTFDLGQKVWTVYRTSDTIKLPCGFCRGAGRLSVEGPSGSREYVDCPKCKGRREIALATMPQWAASEQPLVIGQVRVEITDSPGDGKHGPTSNYGPAHGREERYMCVETGIGSGTLHDVAKLWRSLIEAQDAAENMNLAIREGRDWKPSHWDVAAATGFLDHRDVYEHEPEHVELAEQIVRAFNYVPDEDEALA